MLKRAGRAFGLEIVIWVHVRHEYCFLDRIFFDRFVSAPPRALGSPASIACLVIVDFDLL